MLLIVNEFPPEFKPSIVTLSAPLRSINGNPAFTLAEIVLEAPPFGLILRVVHAPLFRTAPVTGSAVLPVIRIVIVAPVCAPPLIAVKAADKVV